MGRRAVWMVVAAVLVAGAAVVAAVAWPGGGNDDDTGPEPVVASGPAFPAGNRADGLLLPGGLPDGWELLSANAGGHYTVFVPSLFLGDASAPDPLAAPYVLATAPIDPGFHWDEAPLQLAGKPAFATCKDTGLPPDAECLLWRTDGGAPLAVAGRGVDGDRLRAVAAKVTLGGDGIPTVGAPVDGLAPLASSSAASLPAVLLTAQLPKNERVAFALMTAPEDVQLLVRAMFVEDGRFTDRAGRHGIAAGFLNDTIRAAVVDGTPGTVVFEHGGDRFVTQAELAAVVRSLRTATTDDVDDAVPGS